MRTSRTPQGLVLVAVVAVLAPSVPVLAQAAQAFNTQFAKWDKYWVASMQGRGYSIQ